MLLDVDDDNDDDDDDDDDDFKWELESYVAFPEDDLKDGTNCILQHFRRLVCQSDDIQWVNPSYWNEPCLKVTKSSE